VEVIQAGEATMNTAPKTMIALEDCAWSTITWAFGRATLRSSLAVVVTVLATVTVMTGVANADGGGVSFWLPGSFGSLAAVPQETPGWSESLAYYHSATSAGGEVSRAREITIGVIPANLQANLSANLRSDTDIALMSASYAFATPVLGGQASASLAGIYGGNATSLTAALTGTLTTSLGPISFARFDNISNSVTGFGDLNPQFALRWNAGLHNYMTYITGNIPVGAYDSRRIANIGTGYWAIDAGGGYTYFDPQTGHELSAVLGFTNNFKNPITQYQNGVAMHLDWGASQFLNKQIQVGLVGYIYKEIGCDSGFGDRIGCFQSQVVGIGPQVGFVFPVREMQGNLNVKGYTEFAAENRPHGWNVWVTFSLSPAAQTLPTPSSPKFTK
jgi:hypothetical protein